MAAVFLSSQAALLLPSEPVPTVHQLVARIHEQQRNAAYTTALINKQGCVMDWPAHESRLLRDATELREAGGHMGCVAQNTAILPMKYSIRQYVNVALRQYLQLANKTLPAMLVMIISDDQGDLARATTTANVAARVTDKVVEQTPNLQRLSLPLPLRLDLLVLPVRPLVPMTAEGYATVVLTGRGRPLPHVKHTDWILRRDVLERIKRQTQATEVVMLTDGGDAALEGLTSNFGVIVKCEDIDDPTPCVPHGRGRDVHTQQATLICAERDVLPGLMMTRVVRAAHQLGWRVVRAAPGLAQRHQWTAAFLCNSLRGVVPVANLTRYSDEHEMHGWRLQLPSVDASPLPALLQALDGLDCDEHMPSWCVDHEAWNVTDCQETSDSRCT